MIRSRSLALALALGVGLVTVACGSGQQRATARGTSISPAAAAEITVGKTEGAQTVDVNVRHLAPPERLGVGLSQYAVWIIPAGMQPVLAGRLTYDPASQAGQLRATTPFPVFEVVVTAEGQSIGESPNGPVVLRRGLRAPE